MSEALASSPLCSSFAWALDVTRFPQNFHVRLLCPLSDWRQRAAWFRGPWWNLAKVDAALAVFALKAGSRACRSGKETRLSLSGSRTGKWMVQSSRNLDIRSSSLPKSFVSHSQITSVRQPISARSRRHFLSRSSLRLSLGIQ